MKKFEIIPITAESFGNVGSYTLQRINLEVEAESFEILDNGIGVFYDSSDVRTVVHTVPLDKVIVRKIS